LIEHARTFLFVPGDRADRFAKAAAAGADVVIIDLEDAVSPDRKASARAATSDWLAAGHRAVVRVNALGTPFFESDCAALTDVSGVLAVMLPKVSGADDLTTLRRRLPGVRVLPLIESAVGVHRAHEVAAAPGVARLVLGTVDLALDMDTDESWDAMLHTRSSLVLASRVAGLAAPVDGVTRDLHPKTSAADATAARSLGFGAKLCIHPSQVDGVAAAFASSPQEVAWARGVLTLCDGGGARTYQGEMVDEPVLERARRILATADDAP